MLSLSGDEGEEILRAYVFLKELSISSSVLLESFSGVMVGDLDLMTRLPPTPSSSESDKFNDENRWANRFTFSELFPEKEALLVKGDLFEMELDPFMMMSLALYTFILFGVV